jgi:hypothetical protein
VETTDVCVAWRAEGGGVGCVKNPKRPARKPARSRKAKAAPFVLREDRVQALGRLLRQVASGHGGADARLQVDFLRATERCVIRVAVSERSWEKAGDGAWRVEHLEALAERQLVHVDVCTRVGYHLTLGDALVA